MCPLIHLHSKPGNPGRSFDKRVDVTKSLERHYNPEEARSKLAEIHTWLKQDATMSEEERTKFQPAYNLTTWKEYPRGNLDYLALESTGPTQDVAEEAKAMRGLVRKMSALRPHH